MAKKSKSIGEKISESVDKILHPENHEQDKAEAEKLAAEAAEKKADDLAQKSDDESDELNKKVAEKVDVESISQHKKFDKFK